MYVTVNRLQNFDLDCKSLDHVSHVGRNLYTECQLVMQIREKYFYLIGHLKCYLLATFRERGLFGHLHQGNMSYAINTPQSAGALVL